MTTPDEPHPVIPVEQQEAIELIQTMLEFMVTDPNHVCIEGVSHSQTTCESLKCELPMDSTYRNIETPHITISISVAKKDKGIVIGKEGGNIKSIQKIVKCLAARHKCRIEIRLLEN